MSAKLAFGPPAPCGYTASREKLLKSASRLRKLPALAVSPAMQATTSASPACTARAARRSAITPHAPPIGSHSRKRGDSPTCCVNATAVSGASVKLESAQPVDLALRQPAPLQQPRQRAREEPRGRMLRAPRIRHRDRHGGDDVVVVAHYRNNWIDGSAASQFSRLTRLSRIFSPSSARTRWCSAVPASHSIASPRASA